MYSHNSEDYKMSLKKKNQKFSYTGNAIVVSWIFISEGSNDPFFWEEIDFRRYVGSMVEGRMEGKGGLATGGGKGVKMATGA